MTAAYCDRAVLLAAKMKRRLIHVNRPDDPDVELWIIRGRPDALWANDAYMGVLPGLVKILPPVEH